jgi:Uncharacterized membrane protein, required for spore maturation in B.subtilis.
MSKLFGYVCLFSLIVGLLFNRASIMSEAVLNLPMRVFELTVSMIVNACLWNGLLSLASEAGLITYLSHKMRPIFIWLYPQIGDKSEVIGLLASNFIANFMGLGSLAMLSGLKAIKALDMENQQHTKASHSMKMLIIFNTTGCSLFPMSIIAIRNSYQSVNPLGFIGYTLLIGMITLSMGVLIQKGVMKFGK